MSIGAHLIHRCTIARRETRLDELRGEIVAYDEEHLRNQPIRIVTKEKIVFSSERGALITQVQYLGLLPRGVDVQPGDRVQDVVHEDGAEMGHVYDVVGILPRRARSVRHITLRLERYG